MSGHPLARMLDAAAHGSLPRPDGSVTITSPAPGGMPAVVAFTAHHVVAADVDAERIRTHVDPTDVGAPMHPEFVMWLGERIGRVAAGLDVVLAAVASGAGTDLPLTVDPANPRVARALRHRTSVRVHGSDSGVFILGRGLARRWEVSLQVPREHRGQGLGTRLAGAAIDALPQGTPLFAQVAPGNAASLRAFLSAGFRPIGAEVLYPPPG